jgi:two-component system cell cycle sensor histidine kinase/response regulator CckA
MTDNSWQDQEKLMEEYRMKLSEELDLLFNLSPDLLCIADFEGRFLLLNPAWQKTLGFSTDELLARPYVDFVHPDDRDRTLLQGTRLTREPMTIALMNRYRCKDGTYKWLRWNSTPDPARRRIYAVARDITDVKRLQDQLKELNATLEERVRSRTQELERLNAALKAENETRKRAEEALGRTNGMLQSIISASPQAIIAVDRDRNVRLWNPAAAETFGWTADEVLGNKVPFVTDEKRAESNLFNERALHGETFTNHELQRTRRDGAELELLVSAAPTYDDQKAVDGFVTVVSDITEHKKLERQLLRTQRLESLGTLASGIAHDLNNVLAPIGMALQLFRMKLHDPSSQNTLDALESCVNRGASLIRQVLTFARGVQGERVPVQTRHLLEDTERVLQQTLPKSISIVSDVPRDLWVVSADATQLHQILMNLCVNARDAMPAGGTLALTAKNVVLDETYIQLNRQMNQGLTAGPYVMIEVVDTGAGIPAEIRDKIFEPFFTTKEIGKGTGLGLSTVAAIVRSHNGFVNMYSELNRGTSFKIYFPAVPNQAGQESAARAGMAPTGHGELILVVDDEAAVRHITRLTLETHGYRVLEAQDGAEGVAVYAQHREDIQLVISDMDMPVMNGAAMIRSLERINANVRVLSTSGLAGHSKPPDSPAPGPVSRTALPKPYTAEQLLGTVHRVINAA